MAFSKKPQASNNYIVIDFETGGLDCVKNPVTEIAFIMIDGISLKEIDRYQALIHPYDETLIYDERALSVTNISMDLLYEEGQDIEEVVKQVIYLYEKANLTKSKKSMLKPILVGHNIDFDIGFHDHLFYYGLNKSKSHQDEIEKLLKGTRDFYGNFKPDRIDTLDLVKGWMQGEQKMSSFALPNICKEFNIDLNNAHRAMNDVISTVEVLRRVLNGLRFGEGGANSSSFRENFKFPI